MVPPSPFMAKALRMAQQAYQQQEVPIGAVVVDYTTQTILAQAHNAVEARKDVTAHAEMLAIREAAARCGNKLLMHCDLYVTLEPCAMCAQAIAHSRIRRVYFAASDPKSGGVLHGARVFEHPQCHHKPELYHGIAEAQAAELLQKFFASKRT